MKNKIIIAAILMSLSIVLSLVFNDFTIIIGIVVGLFGAAIKYWLTIMQTDRAIEYVKMTGQPKSHMIYVIIRFMIDVLILVFAVKISLNALFAAFGGIVGLKFVLYSTHKKNKGVNH